MKDIKVLRSMIDDIDKEFVKLFEARMNVVEEIAAYKIQTGKALKDPQRERELIQKNIGFLENPKYERLLRVFFKDIMAHSRTHQQDMMGNVHDGIDMIQTPHVAFQGIEGSFSSIALKKFFINGYTTIENSSFEETFETLYNEEADYAILPIENSSTGAINEVYDLMLKYEMQIVGDLYLKVKHHLIGLDKIETIEAVYSHEQGFKQSRLFLSDYDWQHYSYSNTAESVKYVQSLNNPKFAAIGSIEAAEAYGLKVLKENIHDHDYNTTRFVVLSKKQINTEGNKISLVLRLSHEPKALFSILEVIANHEMNMLKIESRPIPDKPWAYMFYIDIEGSLADQETIQMIEEMKMVSHSVLILGNYYSRNGVSE